MLFTIATHTIRGTVREGRFRVLALALLLLFLCSLYGTYDYYASLRTQHAEASAMARGQWENQGDKNPHSAAHYGTYVFKPIFPLAYFDRGVDSYTGNTLFLEAHRSNQAKYALAQDQVATTRLGVLTPAFVLTLLFPLFILTLGFGVAATERQNGNLRLMLAQGLRPATLFWGNVLGLWALVLLLVLPFFLLGGLGLVFAAAPGDFWWRYLFICLFYVLYFGCFIHLALLISAWSGRVNTALVGVLGLWVLVCLVMPRFTVDAARQLAPTPSWQQYQSALQKDLKEGVDGHDPASTYTQRLQEQTLAEYGVDSVHQLPFNWDGFIMQKGEEHETLVYEKQRQKLAETYQRQLGIHQTLGFTSPYLLLKGVSERLAGTDVATYFSFLSAAERYRIQLVGELNGELRDNFAYGDWDGTRGQEFYASNSTFSFSPRPLPELLPELLSPFLALLGWLVVTGLGGLFFYQRLRPF